jgi:hypothetical protein
MKKDVHHYRYQGREGAKKRIYAYAGSEAPAVIIKKCNI